MVMLRIEHSVPNFEGWKQAFDSDPVDRQKSGVRRYQILRPIDDPNFVMIDLEFDTVPQAEVLLAAMRAPRIAGVRCDVGAYEFGALLPRLFLPLVSG
jgi:hypothetical protein